MKKLRSAGLSLAVIAGLGLIHSAQANTVSVFDDVNTLLIDATVQTTPASLSVVIQGFLAPFTGALSDVRADEINQGNSSEATELAFLNAMIDPDVAGALRTCNGNCLDTFVITTTYFLLKFGQDSAYFKNLTGQAITITLASIGGTGSGLSHITQFGPSAVPIPAALPLLLTGLGGIGWLARRRARKTAA